MAQITLDEARGRLRVLADAAQAGTYRRKVFEEVVQVVSLLTTAREARTYVMNAYLNTQTQHTPSTPNAVGTVDGDDVAKTEKHTAYLDAAMVLGRVLDDLILPGASVQGAPPDGDRGNLRLQEGARHDGC